MATKDEVYEILRKAAKQKCDSSGLTIDKLAKKCDQHASLLSSALIGSRKISIEAWIDINNSLGVDWQRALNKARDDDK